MNQDPYFLLPQVSNSDLGNLEKILMPKSQWGDIESAYKNGTLLDAMITEPQYVNYLKKSCHGYTYTDDEFRNSEKMSLAFKKDPFCSQLLKLSECQKQMSVDLEIEYLGFKFTLPARCKWDLWMPPMKHGGDIKSTTATTQEQFIAAIKYFRYDRQRAWYMDISGSDRDILIGVSKVNHKVFKVPIMKGSELYNSGKASYQYLSFKYWSLLHNFFN